jgi:hypothetical protein
VIENIFVEAAKRRFTCELVDAVGNHRIVEPYMIYDSPKGNRLFHCYQVAGFSEGGQPIGWKSPLISSFISASIKGDVFLPRPDYNPNNQKMFGTIWFAIDK